MMGFPLPRSAITTPTDHHTNIGRAQNQERYHIHALETSTKNNSFSLMVKFLLERPADDDGSAGPAILIGLFVAFGGILYGFATPSRREGFTERRKAYDNTDMTRGL